LCGKNIAIRRDAAGKPIGQEGVKLIHLAQHGRREIILRGGVIGHGWSSRAENGFMIRRRQTTAFVDHHNTSRT
jgi:hypothetical protein